MKLWTIVLLSVFVVIFVGCENEEANTLAMVNGKRILKSDITAENTMDALIKKYVIEYESKRLGLSEPEMFSVFDILKTREIPTDEIDEFFKKEFKDKGVKNSSKEELIKLMKEKQYERAREKYISELEDRSTIWIYKDGEKVKYTHE